MASTIQLKTGTGSAVPTSLTQGEIGINIDNGLIYYGSGSGNDVKQLESFTHITASGNISSSGTVFADKLHLKTSTTPGPIIQLENDSGGSGADSFIRFGDSSENYSYALGADDSGNSFRIAYNGSAFDGAVLGTNDVLAIDTAGNITASGNISSSGNVAGLSGSFSHIALEDNSRIVAKNSPSTTYIELQNDDGFQFRANNTEVFTVFSNGAVFNDLGVAQADFRIESDNDTHIFFVDSGNDKVAIGTDTVGSSLLTVDGDITATDITASGTISASIIKSNNIVGDTSQNTQLFVGGAITASGDISSSANVIAQHITASGNIRGTMPQIISANMGNVNLSTENFIPLAEGEIEGTNGDHPRVNLIAPFSGSLRRVVMRSNAAFGTSEFTASLHTIRPGGALSSDKDTVGQCFVDTTGDNNAYAVVFDFTNSVVGSNVIDGGDRVLIGVETTRTNSQNYYFTSVFTWDYQETTGLQTTSTSTSGGSI